VVSPAGGSDGLARVFLHGATVWHWLREGEDSPRFPAARLFQQPAPGGSDGALAKIAIALKDFEPAYVAHAAAHRR